MHRPRRVTAIAISTLAATAGLVPVTAHAAGGGKIYVDNTPGFNCSDTAATAGSPSTPYCTVEAAVATAVPGSDVIVGGDAGAWMVGVDSAGYWPKTAITPPSGTPGDPVTIEAAAPGVDIHGGADGGPAFRLDNVHDVVIKGLVIGELNESPQIVGQSPQRVTLTGDEFGAPVHLTGAQNSSIVASEFFSGSLTVDGGSTGTVIADDIVDDGYTEVTVTDSPGTKMVNDTFSNTEVTIAGESTGTVVENDIFRALITQGAAASEITADYNIVHPPLAGQVEYYWNQATYTDPASFHTATGQGAHDTDADPLLAGTEYPAGGSLAWMDAPTAGSPAIDSGNADAPGIPATDYFGAAPIDDPDTANTGHGTIAYRDRGAIENNGVGGVGLQMTPITDPSAYRTRTFTAPRSGEAWGGTVSYSYDWGDGHTSPASQSATTTHTYAADGDYTVTVTATGSRGQTSTRSQGVIVFPRSRPDVVINYNPIQANGYLLIEADSPNGSLAYVPQGSYTFDWGDGTPAWHGGSNGFARYVQYGHTYTTLSPAPQVTLTIVDNAGWQWTWKFDTAGGNQVPAVSNPPSPGGWTLPAPGGGGGTGGPPPPSQPVVRRLGGGDRYATARIVSQAQWKPGTADSVVLARGDQAPDALAGVPLAAREKGPLLLTDPHALDTATRAEIDRVLGAPQSGRTVYILGGTGAVSPTIETQLRTAGYTVVRLAGGDRFGTALAIAARFGPTTEAIVATGKDFPDALAAGPLGAQRDAPIVLSDGPALDAATATYLKGHQTIDAVGGAAVTAARTLGAGGWTVHELAGANRFATAADVADAMVAASGHAPSGVGVAYAFNFPDALTGGAFAATAGEPLLLTGSGSADPTLLGALQGWAPSLTSVEVFGGVSVVSQAAEDQIAKAIGAVER